MTARRIEPRVEDRDASPRLLLIGVDHRCAPIELRERVTYRDDEARALLETLVAAEDVDEAAVVSTCNRTEVYLLPRREPEAYQLAMARTFLDRAPEIETEGRFYVKRETDAARHLFEVASGLQSMVLGEPEILGQVRRSAEAAASLGASGTVLGRLLRAAIDAGGRARRETAIGVGAASYGYAVVELGRTIFQHLEECAVLLIGAGETARQVARSLSESGARELLVANRGAERAEEFLELFPRSRTLAFEDRHRALATCDVVVASTAAAEPVLRRDDLERAMDARRGRPLLVVDLGLPRNVEPDASRLENLFLQDIDSLENLIERNLKRRREEIPRVQEVLDRELDRFMTWYRGLDAEPLVARLQRRAEKIRRDEVESIRRHFPDDTHPRLERLTRALVKKLLHHPSARLRTSERDELEIARRIFRLDDEDE